jgi:glutaminyl-tRNA synthetase
MMTSVAICYDHFVDSKSGTEGANNYKVKGTIHWVSATHALEAEVRLYDRLFSDPNPDAGGNTTDIRWTFRATPLKAISY